MDTSFRLFNFGTVYCILTREIIVSDTSNNYSDFANFWTVWDEWVFTHFAVHVFRKSQLVGHLKKKFISRTSNDNLRTPGVRLLGTTDISYYIVLINALQSNIILHILFCQFWTSQNSSKESSHSKNDF